jgi:16S rRNA (guanine966-N2)-methyltransferase
MRLRIVAGPLGGRYVTVDKNASGAAFRPTQERVRQAVAETIKARIQGAAVLDLCAGSGAFGFEMASRGAASIHFVEADRARAQCVAKHAALFGIQAICTVVQTDARKFAASSASCRQTYDIVFYDPPYGDAALASLASDLSKLLSARGILIYERDISNVPSADAFPQTGFSRETREYGDTAVEFISRV